MQCSGHGENDHAWVPAMRVVHGEPLQRQPTSTGLKPLMPLATAGPDIDNATDVAIAASRNRLRVMPSDGSAAIHSRIVRPDSLKKINRRPLTIHCRGTTSLDTRAMKRSDMHLKFAEIEIGGGTVNRERLVV